MPPAQPAPPWLSPTQFLTRLLAVVMVSAPRRVPVADRARPDLLSHTPYKEA
jgi:hypothetical protein